MIKTKFGKIDETGANVENNKNVSKNILKCFLNNQYSDMYNYFTWQFVPTLNNDSLYNFFKSNVDSNNLSIKDGVILFHQKFFGYQINKDGSYDNSVLHSIIVRELSDDNDKYLEFLSDNFDVFELYNAYNSISIKIEKDMLDGEKNLKEHKLFDELPDILQENEKLSSKEIKKILRQEQRSYDNYCENYYDKQMKKIENKEKSIKKIEKVKEV